MARATISASRWHTLPVVIWIAGTPGAQPYGVVLGRQIPHDHAKVESLPQIRGHPLDQGRFPRTGGGQEIRGREPLGGKVASVALGQPVVLLLDGLLEVERAVLFVEMRMGVVMGVRVIMLMRMVMHVGVRMLVIKAGQHRTAREGTAFAPTGTPLMATSPGRLQPHS